MCRAGKDCFHYQNEHCALFENDLRYICPRNDKDLKRKLAAFAAQYGFRLRFYRQGLFVIFGKRPLRMANDAGAFSPPRQSPFLLYELQGWIGRSPACHNQ